MSKPSKYNLYIYDLIGNDEEGYEVNDFTFLGHYYLEENASDKEILKEILAKEGVTIDKNSSAWPQALYFLNNKGFPIGELQKA